MKLAHFIKIGMFELSCRIQTYILTMFLNNQNERGEQSYEVAALWCIA